MTIDAVPNSALALTPARRRGTGVWLWLWLAGLCVVLGLVTSVGVAWGIAWHPNWFWVKDQKWTIVPIPRSQVGVEQSLLWGITERYDNGRSTANVQVFLADWFDGVVANRVVTPTTLPREVRAGFKRHTPLLRTPEATRISFNIRCWGWPMCCFSLEDACTAQTASPRPQTEFANMSVSVFWSDPVPGPITNPAFNLRPHYNAIEVGNHLLPTFPLWPGLLADTAIFAGAWGVLIFTPLVVRRWLRARRGGCPQCGYSREGLKSDAVCPECGHGA